MGVKENGGPYASVCMRTNLIFSFWEMLQNENNEIKFTRAGDPKPVFGTADVVAHYCGCRFSSHMLASGYAKCVFLDTFRAGVHECDKRYHPDDKAEMSNCNSQAFEQLWSIVDKLHFATNFSYGRYRRIYHHYCVWGNEFVWKCAVGDSKMDTNDLNSRGAFLKSRKCDISTWTYFPVGYIFS